MSAIAHQYEDTFGNDAFAAICMDGYGGYVVQFDYGGAGNQTAWNTHEEAVSEAVRLFTEGHATRIEDHIAMAGDLALENVLTADEAADE